ncbi:MAG: hypothetical protein IJA10_12410 [Lachnospiraceae bacterium]|nr:hypothetical protein [Lachnospiraceae bacterium]
MQKNSYKLEKKKDKKQENYEKLIIKQQDMMSGMDGFTLCQKIHRKCSCVNGYI